MIDEKERERLYARSAYNFVRIEFPKGGPDDRYARAAADLSGWIRQEVLRRDGRESFYLHEHEFEVAGRRLTRRGIFGALRLYPQSEGVVLPHELTFPKAKADRLELLRATRANTSPVFGMFDDDGGLMRSLGEAPRAAADETTRVLLQDMTEAVSRADKIIGGLLSYSREGELDLAPVDLNTTLDASLLLVKHELDKGRIRIIKDLDHSLPMLQLDQFKIQQVFVNVLTNALHAIEHDGEVQLRTSLETRTSGRRVGYRHGDLFTPGERVAMVQIDDSGPGIPDAHLGKIFDPFFTTKPTGIGTGLGLSVCQQIVEMHSGTIEIENRSEGGASVTIFFKIGKKEQSNAEKTSPPRR